MDDAVLVPYRRTSIFGKKNGFWVVTESMEVSFFLTSDPRVVKMCYGNGLEALIGFPKSVLSLPTDAWDTTKAVSH